MRTRIDAIADGLDRFITAERLKLYPRAILIGQVILIGVMIGIPLLVAVEKQALFPDFAAPWTGARFFRDGRMDELFDVHAQWAFQQEHVRNDAPSWFVSPPHVALVYSPLALVSFRTAGLIWTLISIVCVVVSIRLIEPFAPRFFRNHRLATTLLLLSTYPVFELLGAGQQSAVTFLLLAAGIRLALADHQGWAGVLFALGAIKPQLFIMVPFVLIAMRMWKALATGAVTGLATLALSYLVFGREVFAAWFEALGSPMYAEMVQIDQAWKMIGLPALAVTLVPPQAAAFVNGLGTLITIAVVAFACWKIFGWTKAGADPRAVWAGAILAMILASPHLVAYDLIMVLVPALYLAENALNRTTRVTLLVLYLLTWTTAVRHLLALQLIWPVTLIDASWATISIVFLWVALDRHLSVESGSAQLDGTDRPVTDR